MTPKKKLFVTFVSLILVLSILSPTTAMAAGSESIMPCASYYLSAYNTYICAMGSGRIEVWFEVMGTGYMDDIGTLSIRLYESSDNSNWSLVKTFLHENYSSILGHYDYYHLSCVSYQGTAKKYYKAYVCIWAGNENVGDTRYMWATSVRAT